MNNASQPFVSVPQQLFGGLYCEASGTSLPEGASPRTINCDFTVGEVNQRDGLESIFSFTSNVTGPNLATLGTDVPISGGSPWTNPNNISMGNYATFFPSGGATHSDQLLGSIFNFALQNLEIQGIEVGITGYVNGAHNSIQVGITNGMSTPVGLTKTGTLPNLAGRIVLGSPFDLWGSHITFADLNSAQFGAYVIASGDSVPEVSGIDVTVYQVSGDVVSASTFNYIKTFSQTDGSILTLVVSGQGDIFQEDVLNNEGFLEPVFSQLSNNDFCQSATIDDREFMAFSNLLNGTDIPLTYTPPFFDRLSQVGPGAAPAASTTSAGTTITSITQNPIVDIPTSGGGTSGSWVVWSDSPSDTGTFGTANTPGNIMSWVFPVAYQLPSYIQVGVNIVISGVQTMNGYNPNSGVGSNPAYYTITTVGQPIPGQEYYTGFTITIPQTGFYAQRFQGGSAFQATIATMTTATQVPNLEVGGQFEASGTGGGPPTGYDGTWTVLTTPNASQMNITSTSLLNGVATYGFILVPGGSNPAAGQAVTVTQTLNGNGIFNVTNAIISSANAGSFTVNITGNNVASSTEDGSGIIFGTIFTFDAFQIVGNTTGGTVVIVGIIGSGIRMVCYSFLTRNGYITQPSPVLTFDVPAGASAIAIDNLAIGPPNVIARIIHLTAANGSFFYNIPVPVTVNNNGTNVVNSSTWVNDNITTHVQLSFSDGVLLGAGGTQIDIQGNDLFNCVELGASTMIVPYSQRAFAIGEQNKVSNLLNWSFDGGIGVNQGSSLIGIPGANLSYPLGWLVDPLTPAGTYGVISSPIFGFSYQISNTTSGIVPYCGAIYQNAYQDEDQVAIIEPSTAYSVRITASLPSGPTTAGNGGLIVDLYSPTRGTTLGVFDLPLADLTAELVIYTGTLVTTPFSPVPNDLRLRLWVDNAPSEMVVLVDRCEIFPTAQPTLNTQVTGSYQQNFESFDEIDGVILGTTINQQAIVSAFVLFDTFYLVKTGSLLAINDNNSTEPAYWNIPRTISPAVGAFGPNAVTTGIDEPNSGEEWSILAGPAGAYIFNGGQPVKLTEEIQSLWNMINRKYAYTSWVKNDIVNRRILFGVPLNELDSSGESPDWLPAGIIPNGTNPTSPNVVLALNYKQLNTASALEDSPGLHRSYSGKLIASEIVRKWSIWTIESPCASFATRADGSTPLFLGNSTSTGKIYELSDTALSDDGAAIYQDYVTSPFVSKETGQGLQMGVVRMSYAYMTAELEGIGPLSIFTYPNTLDTPYVNQLLPNLTLPASTNGDVELPLNEVGSRLFLEFISNQVDSEFILTGLAVIMHADMWSGVRGVND